MRRDLLNLQLHLINIYSDGQTLLVRRGDGHAEHCVNKSWGWVGENVCLLLQRDSGAGVGEDNTHVSD